MADKIVTTEQLVMVGEFKDGDDRTIALDNPKYDPEDDDELAQAATDINAIANTVKTKQLLIGDKAGADFLRFKSAKIVHKTTITLDLTA